MEKNPIYYTEFNKPIYKGQVYYAVTQNNAIIKTIADTNVDPNIKARFLNNTGATNYLKKMELKPIKTAPVETIEEVEPTEEEVLLKLPVFEQLDYVKSQEDFDKWLERNSYTLSSNYRGLLIRKKNTPQTVIFSVTYSFTGVPHCCGGREMGSHDGMFDASVTKSLTTKRFKILAKYIAKTFIEGLRINNNNYGIISYVRDSGSAQSPSGRIGMILDECEEFTKVSFFRNPNTSNIIVIYTVSNKWKLN